MPVFKFTAKNMSSGQKVTSEIQAESEQAAAKTLRNQNLSPLDITMTHNSSKLFGLKNRITTKDKVLFSRQLSTLINAGLPIVQSLRTVQGQLRNKRFQEIVGTIIASIESGSALSAAMAKYTEHFNKVYISLIAAGETSGTLDKSLSRLADQQEKDAEIISKVRGAMVYPAIVLLVLFAVVGFMIIKVLPQVEQLYSDIPGANLPLVTTILLAVSSFATNYWWVVLLMLVFLVIVTSRWARTLGGEKFIDKIKMKMPMVGPLFMKMYMARFARTSATLVSSGVPLLQVMEITSQAINNILIEESLKKAAIKVKGGKSLSETLQGDRNFLSLVPDMISIGEQSGSLEDMLDKIGDYYEKEVDQQLKTISTIIEPILMVILGIFAFIIVAAVLLPIYGLAGQTLIR